MTNPWLMWIALAMFIVSVILLVNSVDEFGCVKQPRLSIAILLFIIASALIIIS